MRVIVLLIGLVTACSAQERFDQFPILKALADTWTGNLRVELDVGTVLDVTETSVGSISADGRSMRIAVEATVDGELSTAQWTYSNLQGTGHFDAEIVHADGNKVAFKATVVENGAGLHFEGSDARTGSSDESRLVAEGELLKFVGTSKAPDGKVVVSFQGEFRRSTAAEVASPSAAESQGLTFEDASAELSRRSRVEARPYSTYDFGRERDTRSVSFVMTNRSAKQTVLEMQGRLSSGLVVFIGTSNWLGNEKPNGVEVVLARGADQFAILAIARSDGINYGHETEDVIRRLRQLDRDYGIAIFHAETDTIECRILRPVADPLKLARELYEFCPDIVDQGVETVERLAAELSARKEIYLWWD